MWSAAKAVFTRLTWRIVRIRKKDQKVTNYSIHEVKIKISVHTHTHTHRMKELLKGKVMGYQQKVNTIEEMNKSKIGFSKIQMKSISPSKERTKPTNYTKSHRNENRSINTGLTDINKSIIN